MNDYYIALGSNLPSSVGSSEHTLRSALALMESSGITLVRSSRFYWTPCFPAGAGPDYVNAAAHVRADCAPNAFLQMLHDIESHFGRERAERWGMRTLDLDLIACGDTVTPDVETYKKWYALSPDLQSKAAPDQLILPHPRLQDRAFVLVPLMDIAANWVHPVLNRTVKDMHDALSPDALAEIAPL